MRGICPRQDTAHEHIHVTGTLPPLNLETDQLARRQRTLHALRKTREVQTTSFGAKE